MVLVDLFCFDVLCSFFDIMEFFLVNEKDGKYFFVCIFILLFVLLLLLLKLLVKCIGFVIFVEDMIVEFMLEYFFVGCFLVIVLVDL